MRGTSTSRPPAEVNNPLPLVPQYLAFGNDGLSPIWPFLYFAMMGFSFLFYWPVTLALVARAAPSRRRSRCAVSWFTILRR